MSNEVNTRLLERASEIIDCSVENCASPIHGRKLCSKHYKRWYKGKNPHAPSIRDARSYLDSGEYIAIPLGVGASQGWAIVDKENEWLTQYKWHINKQGYASRDPAIQTPNLMHHLIIGRPKKGYDIDHINRDKLDNTKVNLRYVTRSVNCHNSSKSNGVKYSAHRGVTYDIARDRFKASLTINGNTRVMYASTEEIAINKRKQLEDLYYV